MLVCILKNSGLNKFLARLHGNVTEQCFFFLFADSKRKVTLPRHLTRIPFFVIGNYQNAHNQEPFDFRHNHSIYLNVCLILVGISLGKTPSSSVRLKIIYWSLQSMLPPTIPPRSCAKRVHLAVFKLHDPLKSLYSSQRFRNNIGINLEINFETDLSPILNVSISMIIEVQNKLIGLFFVRGNALNFAGSIREYHLSASWLFRESRAMIISAVI